MTYWLKLSPKIREQILRAGRLFAITLGGSLIALQGKHITGSLIVAAIVGAAETVFRSVVPVVPVKAPVVAPVTPADGQGGVMENSVIWTLVAIAALVALVIWILNATGH